jgi:hypothetical protein
MIHVNFGILGQFLYNVMRHFAVSGNLVNVGADQHEFNGGGRCCVLLRYRLLDLRGDYGRKFRKQML